MTEGSNIPNETPLVPLPEGMECYVAGCSKEGTEMAYVKQFLRYRMACPEHVPAPPKLVDPTDQA